MLVYASTNNWVTKLKNKKVNDNLQNKSDLKGLPWHEGIKTDSLLRRKRGVFVRYHEPFYGKKNRVHFSSIENSRYGIIECHNCLHNALLCCCFSLNWVNLTIKTNGITQLTYLVTGIDSPVISDSSVMETPSTTRPSTGILLPGTTWGVV